MGRNNSRAAGGIISLIIRLIIMAISFGIQKSAENKRVQAQDRKRELASAKARNKLERNSDVIKDRRRIKDAIKVLDDVSPFEDS
ncbi:MAG TPA: hypothetical protein PKV16_05415 [Caldisericia bacterium]|nr:hypothetical protein [Caldisericia bacterium]HPF48750.1 hypothetical protein [Caldisericia bacterium]HPI83590.1 hypothetical protein [Caldisericia bacterium]HPQ93205.1 hypothetical protein [Caldisericia bacterium]HRV74962.1 hypothetical protein [Caldisericia bacterium]